MTQTRNCCSYCKTLQQRRLRNYSRAARFFETVAFLASLPPAATPRRWDPAQGGHGLLPWHREQPKASTMQAPLSYNATLC